MLISRVSKLKLKFLQVRLQQIANWELSDLQTGFRKGRGTRDQNANICWTIEETKKFQKPSASVSLVMLKAFDCVGEKKKTCGKFLDGDTRWHYLSPENTVWVKILRTGHGTMDRLKNDKLVYCHPAYLTCVQSTSCKILGRMNHKQDSIFQGEISTISDMPMLPFLWHKLKRN